LTIDAGVTLAVGANTLTVTTALSNNGLITVSTGNVSNIPTGEVGAFTFTGTNTIPARTYTNLTLSGAGSNVIFNAPTGTLTVSGDWLKTGGIFNHNNGTVVLNGTSAQSVTMDNSAFYILTITNTNTAGVTFTDTLSTRTLNAASGVKKISFAAANIIAPNTITNTFNVNGSSGNLIELAPAVSATTWYLNAPTSTVTYVRVSYSTEAVGKVITANYSINGGNNVRWSFGGLTFTGTGLWTDAVRWSTGVLPGNNDQTTIDGICTLSANVTGSAAIDLLVINSGTPLNPVSLDLAGYNITTAGGISNSGTLTLQGNETISGGLTNYSGSTVIYNGSGTYTSLKAGNSYYNLTFNGSGSWAAANNLTISNNLEIQQGIFTAPSGTITISGNWTKTGGTFNHNNGTVTFDKVAATSGNVQTLNAGSSSFYNLTHSGSGTLQLAAALDVNGAFLNSAGTFNSYNQNMNFAGDWSNTGSAIFTRGSGTLTFDGTGTLTNSSSASLDAVTISGTVTLGSNITMISNSGAGTLNLGNNNYILTITGTGTPLGVGTFERGTGSTVIYTGSGSNTYVAAVNYHNLTLLPASNTNYLLAGNTSASGNWDNNTTLNAGAYTVTFNGTGTQTLDNASSSFYNLTHSGSGTLQLNNNISVTNNLTNSAGIFDSNNKNITIAGNWSNSATFTAGSGTVTFDGTTTISGSSTNSFYNVTINSTKSLTGPASGTINVAGNWLNSGTFTHNSGTVKFNGSVAQTINGTNTWYNLYIDNTYTSPDDTYDVDPSAVQTVTNTLTVNDGQWTPNNGDTYRYVVINTNGIMNPDPGVTIYVSGSWTRTGTGTFTANSGTVSFNGGGGGQPI
ncbi:MAG: hypothetical protein WC560_13155, partial [Syntrophales bacterium]